jgi:hypothetical protein
MNGLPIQNEPEGLAAVISGSKPGQPPLKSVGSRPAVMGLIHSRRFALGDEGEAVLCGLQNDAAMTVVFNTVFTSTRQLRFRHPNAACSIHCKDKATFNHLF